MYTLAHLSDVHLGGLALPRPDELLSKRALGFLSWHLRRRAVHEGPVLAARIRERPGYALLAERQHRREVRATAYATRRARNQAGAWRGSPCAHMVLRRIAVKTPPRDNLAVAQPARLHFV